MILDRRKFTSNNFLALGRREKRCTDSGVIRSGGPVLFVETDGHIFTNVANPY